MTSTMQSVPTEYPEVSVEGAAHAEAGRIPITRELVMNAVERVMIEEDRPAFRKGGALEQAGESGRSARNGEPG